MDFLHLASVSVRNETCFITASLHDWLTQSALFSCWEWNQQQNVQHYRDHSFHRVNDAMDSETRADPNLLHLLAAWEILLHQVRILLFDLFASQGITDYRLNWIVQQFILMGFKLHSGKVIEWEQRERRKLSSPIRVLIMLGMVWNQNMTSQQWRYPRRYQIIRRLDSLSDR